MRAIPGRSPKPPEGGFAAASDLRMRIPDGLGDDLWAWMMDRGWREISFQPDHRRYRDIPEAWAKTLANCNYEQRETVFEIAVGKAQSVIV